jgi:hypothetical protein
LHPEISTPTIIERRQSGVRDADVWSLGEIVVHGQSGASSIAGTPELPKVVDAE